MSTSKTLLLFILSSKPEVYINILTHCIEQENVRNVYFVANREVPGRDSVASDEVRKIIQELNKLAAQHDLYKKTLNLMPNPERFAEHIIRADFNNLEKDISIIKKKFGSLDNLILDVTACKKALAMAVISAYMSSQIVQVCCFELEDEVYSESWKATKTRLYHDLRDASGVTYYTYHYFSENDTVRKTFARVQRQKAFITVLFFLLLLSSSIIVIRFLGQLDFFPLFFGALSLIISLIGLFNDYFGIRERFFKL
jgi:hypothetical protein